MALILHFFLCAALALEQVAGRLTSAGFPLSPSAAPDSAVHLSSLFAWLRTQITAVKARGNEQAQKKKKKRKVNIGVCELR